MRCCSDVDASENKQQFIGIASPPSPGLWVLGPPLLRPTPQVTLVTLCSTAVGAFSLFNNILQPLEGVGFRSSPLPAYKYF